MKNRVRVPNLQATLKADEYTDVKALLIDKCKKYEDNVAFTLKHKHGKTVLYENISYQEYFEKMVNFINGMVESGFGGKRLAIIGNNSIEWTIGYFGQICGNGIVIPLDKGLPYEELVSSLNRSYADVLLFDVAHKELIEQLISGGDCRNLEFICMNEAAGCMTMNEMIEIGKRAKSQGRNHFEEYVVYPDETSIILFTSGTTSLAKAVQLSHRNVASNIYALNITEEVREDDINMAFLPYHHTFGMMAQMVVLSAGAATTYCDGLKYIQKNIVEYKVSVFVCVPLLIESMYKKIMATIKKQNKESKVKFAMKLSGFLLKFGIDIRRKLFKEVHEQLGGNLRFIISGASGIDPEVLKGFTAFGFDTVQGYGMTETSPVLAAESLAEQRIGSIGKAVPGVELCIEDPNDDGIGEIVARGPNVMKGYFENQEATDEILEDGWLHTGDLGYMDKDGYLFICGRKKNVIVLKNGKNVYPEELEVLISNYPYVEENMVYGEPKKNDGNENDLALVAKIVYKPDIMEEQYNATTEEEIERIIKADIDRINDRLPAYKQLNRIQITDQPMIKTTTGKVKRYANI